MVRQRVVPSGFFCTCLARLNNMTQMEEGRVSRLSTPPPLAGASDQRERWSGLPFCWLIVDKINHAGCM